MGVDLVLANGLIVISTLLFFAVNEISSPWICQPPPLVPYTILGSYHYQRLDSTGIAAFMQTDCGEFLRDVLVERFVQLTTLDRAKFYGLKGTKGKVALDCNAYLMAWHAEKKLPEGVTIEQMMPRHRVNDICLRRDDGAELGTVYDLEGGKGLGSG